MTELKLTAELVQALKDLQGELQQMNKTLSTIAAKSKQAGGSDTEGRYAGPKPGSRPFRSEAGGGSSTPSRGPSTRFGAKKSPSRSKSAFPPKKGDGYPKKPR